jgi:hypothetical protein
MYSYKRVAIFKAIGIGMMGKYFEQTQYLLEMK